MNNSNPFFSDLKPWDPRRYVYETFGENSRNDCIHQIVHALASSDEKTIAGLLNAGYIEELGKQVAGLMAIQRLYVEQCDELSQRIDSKALASSLECLTSLTGFISTVSQCVNIANQNVSAKE